MKKLKLVIALFVFAAFAIASCNKTPDDPPAPKDKHELLYDKWWYNVGNQGRGAHYFNSDGTCQITIPPSSGVWKWSVNDSLIVTMDNYPPMTLHFTKIEETEMEYWPTFEPEGNLYQFSTTEP